MKLIQQILIELIRIPLLAIWYAQGWGVEIPMPQLDKFVIIAVPHTTNWDYYHVMMMALRERRRPHSTTKHTLFFFPLGFFLRLSGAIPINREQALNAVDWMADMIKNAPERFILVITPEGTRNKTKYWKSGFYYTTLQAGVPLVCAYIDYKRKRIGFAEPMRLTGDIDKDFEPIKAFYEQYGRNPRHLDKLSDIALKERKYHLSSARDEDAAVDEPVSD
jgi:1-acyl-sn-glycerol-3-phosphate acyltransferase